MYPINVKTAQPIGPNICKLKEGLWLVEIEKVSLKNSRLLWFKHYTILLGSWPHAPLLISRKQQTKIKLPIEKNNSLEKNIN